MEHSELIAGLRRGDGAAFEALIKTYTPILLPLARFRLRGDYVSYAEDALQDTFIQAWSKIETFKGESQQSLLRWLRTILAHYCVYYYRINKKFVFGPRQDLEEPESGVIDPDRSFLGQVCNNSGSIETPEEILGKKETRTYVNTKVNHLKENERVVILFKYFSGLSYGVIAQLLLIKAGTLRIVSRRGRQSLRRIIDLSAVTY